jgi:GTP1/Obg family GTP-binding protein
MMLVRVEEIAKSRQTKADNNINQEIKMKKTTHRFIAVFAAALTMSAAQAIALSPPQQDARPSVQQEFDRQTLEKYAAASSEVGKIQSELAQELQSAPDQDKAKVVQKEATRKMTLIIKNQGLDVPTFNAIARQVRFDPALGKEIEQIGKQVH